MKTLSSYTITNVDESNQNLTFTLSYSDNSSDEHTVSYKEVGYDSTEKVGTKDVPTGEVDADGNPITRKEDIFEVFSRKRPMFDISNPTLLGQQIKAYAESYLNGLEVVAPSVENNVSDLVGQQQEV